MFLKSVPLRSLLAALLILLAGTSEVSAARKLYLLAVADTKDPTIGKHASSDIGAIHDTMFGSIAKSELVLVNPVRDMQATQKGILAAINRLNPTSEDAVMLYYSGHGAYGKEDKHYLVTQNGKDWTHRQVLVDALRQKGFGLIVFMTDSCFNFSSKPPVAMAPFIQPPEATLPLYQALFFRSNGLIDVNSAKKGQVAGTYPELGRGSLFTSAFCRTLRDNENDASKTWDSILDQAGATTRNEFRRLYPEGHEVETADGIFNQRDQQLTKLAVELTPYSPTNGGGGDGGGNGGGGVPVVNTIPSVRLGLTVRNHQGSGVLVTVVAQGGPATKCFDSTDGLTYNLEPGDSILSINGTEISDVNEFATQIRGSAPKAQIVVLGKAGDTHEFTVQLNPLNGGGNPVVNKGTRFGAYVATNGNRVRVTGIVPNSPAARCLDADGENWELSDGDIIRRVNGQVVSSEPEFRQAIVDSPQEMTLEVRGTDGKIYQFTVTLNY